VYDVIFVGLQTNVDTFHHIMAPATVY